MCSWRITRARVWTLTKVTFTGAAILRRDKAAYRDTWIELSSEYEQVLGYRDKQGLRCNTPRRRRHE